MSFKKLTKVLKRPNEQYFLLKKETYTKEEKVKFVKDEVGNSIKKTKYIYKDSNGKIIDKDAVGNNPEQYQVLQELKGVIQHDQYELVGNEGEYVDISYKGYFTPTFLIDKGCLSDYRIKSVNDLEIIYFKITKYDSNNFFRKKRSHISLNLKEDVKIEGRSKTIK